jgi:hypothetical protein
MCRCEKTSFICQFRDFKGIVAIVRSMVPALARNEVISNPCHWHAFPPSPRTLWELPQRSSAKAGSALIIAT